MSPSSGDDRWLKGHWFEEAFKPCVVPYQDLPSGAKRALARYALEHRYLPRLWKDRFAVFTDVRCSFVELPAADVAKVIFGSMVPEERPDANGDWKSWADYHAWYCSQSNIPRHGRENRWPSLVWTETDEVLMDGWHRLHSYFRAGHATIPLVCADWETFWRRADVADRNFTT